MGDIKKEDIVFLLKEQKFEILAGLVAGRRSLLGHLSRLLCEPAGLLRWRAIEGLGAAAARLAAENPEAARNIIRNLIWTINEESGGIGWGAAESIGEIIYRCPDAFPEFASIVISRAEEQMLRPGVLWAAGRIAQARPDLVREYLPDLAGFLDDPDPVVRGYTLRLFGIMGEGPDFTRHPHLLSDGNTIPLYENGRIAEVSVAELAAGLNRPRHESTV